MTTPRRDILTLTNAYFELRSVLCILLTDCQDKYLNIKQKLDIVQLDNISAQVVWHVSCYISQIKIKFNASDWFLQLST